MNRRPIVETQIQSSEQVFVLFFLPPGRSRGQKSLLFFPSYVVWIWKSIITVFPQVSKGRWCWSLGHWVYVWIIWYLEQDECLYCWHQVATGLRQSCLMSLLQFVIFIDRSLRYIEVWSNSSLLTCFFLPLEFWIGNILDIKDAFAGFLLMMQK